MAAGRVVCSGSTLFLKKRFGDGYSLRVLPDKGCVVTAVTSTVKSFLPEASLNSTAQEELLYSLPDDTRRFAGLLEELSNKKQFLKINHVGLSLTSMEQVFLRVCKTLDPATAAAVKDEVAIDVSGPPLPTDGVTQGSAVANGVNTDAFRDTRYLFNSQANIDSRLTGVSLAVERLMSLCLKRAIYTKRKWVLLLTQGLFPVLVTLMCLFVDAAFFGSNAAEPPRDLTLQMFDWTQSFVESDNESLYYHNCYEDLFNAPFYVNSTENTTEQLLNAGLEDVFHYRENYVTSALFRREPTKTMTRLMYQSIPFHSPGVGMNLISNAMLHCATNSTKNTISTRNYPLPIDNRYLLEDSATTGSAFVYSMMMPTALAFLSASFLVFPLQERVSKAKQIQLMTGTPAWMLWSTSFLWDLLSYCVSALLVLACFLLVDSQGSFTQPGAPGALWLLLFAYGFGALPLAYLFSFPFSTAASGFSILALLNIVTGMIITTATWALESSKQPSLLILANFLGNVSSFIPAYPASKGFKNLIDMGTYNTQCDIVDPSLVTELCDSIFHYNVSSPFIPCCPQCNQHSNVTCFEALSYLQWKSPGMGSELVWMFGDGLIFLLMLTLVEAGLGDFIRQVYWRAVRAVWRSQTPPPRVVPADDDVVRETRTAQINMRLPRTNAALVVEGLTKEFAGVGVTAVNNVFFHVVKGECFGLLGVNGAGKTTTFRMLTGDERPTAGNARIGNTYLSQGKNKFVQEIGYCPQFDAILEELTGEEMLSLMAGLRGMPRHRRRHAISELVALVDLTECYRRQVATFSGGNKRKLSTAMALIGDPALVFLDEPTTGVDPASRRRVWSAVRAARSRGQSIILTSHSMDECEALCTRLVIMTRGQLRCAGTPAHLKAKFSQGYSLQVKLRNGSGNQCIDDTKFEAALSKLMQAIQLRLPGATMTDQHRGQLAYLVPPTLSWSQLFTTMEELKQGNIAGQSLVEDYAATDPSLEHIFLAFAREGDGRVVETEFETKF